MAKVEVKCNPTFQTLIYEGNRDTINDMLFEKLAKAIGGEYCVIR